MKSEAECYSIDDLERDGSTAWEGVRNYQARNFMRDKMAPGDEVLFYHSNGKPSAVYGFACVSGSAHPDKTQFDSKSEYYDGKATPEKPIWFCVDIQYIAHIQEPLSLSVLKNDPQTATMLVCQPGSRLSVQPVSQQHFKYIQQYIQK